MADNGIGPLAPPGGPLSPPQELATPASAPKVKQADAAPLPPEDQISTASPASAPSIRPPEQRVRIEANPHIDAEKILEISASVASDEDIGLALEKDRESLAKATKLLSERHKTLKEGIGGDQPNTDAYGAYLFRFVSKVRERLSGAGAQSLPPVVQRALHDLQQRFPKLTLGEAVVASELISEGVPAGTAARYAAMLWEAKEVTDISKPRARLEGRIIERSLASRLIGYARGEVSRLTETIEDFQKVLNTTSPRAQATAFLQLYRDWRDLNPRSGLDPSNQSLQPAEAFIAREAARLETRAKLTMYGTIAGVTVASFFTGGFAAGLYGTSAGVLAAAAVGTGVSMVTFARASALLEQIQSAEHAGVSLPEAKLQASLQYQMEKGSFWLALGTAGVGMGILPKLAASRGAWHAAIKAGLIEIPVGALQGYLVPYTSAELRRTPELLEHVAFTGAIVGGASAAFGSALGVTVALVSRHRAVVAAGGRAIEAEIIKVPADQGEAIVLQLADGTTLQVRAETALKGAFSTSDGPRTPARPKGAPPPKLILHGKKGEAQPVEGQLGVYRAPSGELYRLIEHANPRLVIGPKGEPYNAEANGKLMRGRLGLLSRDHNANCFIIYAHGEVLRFYGGGVVTKLDGEFYGLSTLQFEGAPGALLQPNPTAARLSTSVPIDPQERFKSFGITGYWASDKHVATPSGIVSRTDAKEFVGYADARGDRWILLPEGRLSASRIPVVSEGSLEASRLLAKPGALVAFEHNGRTSLLRSTGEYVVSLKHDGLPGMILKRGVAGQPFKAERAPDGAIVRAGSQMVRVKNDALEVCSIVETTDTTFVIQTDEGLRLVRRDRTGEPSGLAQPITKPLVVRRTAWVTIYTSEGQKSYDVVLVAEPLVVTELGGIKRALEVNANGFTMGDGVAVHHGQTVVIHEGHAYYVQPPRDGLVLAVDPDSGRVIALPETPRAGVGPVKLRPASTEPVVIRGSAGAISTVLVDGKFCRVVHEPETPRRFAERVLDTTHRRYRPVELQPFAEQLKGLPQHTVLAELEAGGGPLLQKALGPDAMTRVRRAFGWTDPKEEPYILAIETETPRIDGPRILLDEPGEMGAARPTFEIHYAPERFRIFKRAGDKLIPVSKEEVSARFWARFGGPVDLPPPVAGKPQPTAYKLTRVSETVHKVVLDPDGRKLEIIVEARDLEGEGYFTGLGLTLGAPGGGRHQPPLRSVARALALLDARAQQLGLPPLDASVLNRVVLSDSHPTARAEYLHGEGTLILYATDVPWTFNLLVADLAHEVWGHGTAQGRMLFQRALFEASLADGLAPPREYGLTNGEEFFSTITELLPKTEADIAKRPHVRALLYRIAQAGPNGPTELNKMFGAALPLILLWATTDDDASVGRSGGH